MIIGKATIPEAPTPVLKVNEYLNKYSQGIKDISMTPESFNIAYNVRIEITPTKLRGI